MVASCFRECGPRKAAQHIYSAHAACLWVHRSQIHLAQFVGRSMPSRGPSLLLSSPVRALDVCAGWATPNHLVVYPATVCRKRCGVLRPSERRMLHVIVTLQVSLCPQVLPAVRLPGEGDERSSPGPVCETSLSFSDVSVTAVCVGDCGSRRWLSLHGSMRLSNCTLERAC